LTSVVGERSEQPVILTGCWTHYLGKIFGRRHLSYMG